MRYEAYGVMALGCPAKTTISQHTSSPLQAPRNCRPTAAIPVPIRIIQGRMVKHLVLSSKQHLSTIAGQGSRLLTFHLLL
jgi:hypothetical protein